MLCKSENSGFLKKIGSNAKTGGFFLAWTNTKWLGNCFKLHIFYLFFSSTSIPQEQSLLWLKRAFLYLHPGHANKTGDFVSVLRRQRVNSAALFSILSSKYFSFFSRHFPLICKASNTENMRSTYCWLFWHPACRNNATLSHRKLRVTFCHISATKTTLPII